MFGKKGKDEERTLETLEDVAQEVKDRIPDDVAVLTGNQLPLPVHMLLSMYATAPTEYHESLNKELIEFVMTVMPRVKALHIFGEYIRAAEVDSLVDDYRNAMEYAREIGVDPGTDAALDYFAEVIGTAIDDCVRSRLKTASNEEVANRRANLDLVAGHAVIMRGLKALTDVPSNLTAADVPSGEEPTPDEA